MHVVATAGHVDHGKSTLVRALTGMEPDRWAEERRRGMTIDLGYAWSTLPSGSVLAFVDVPGHERFLGNMLAGLGPAPAVLFVVAADEGWRRQSAEHLAAVSALGLRDAVVAVTRSDLADPGPATEQALEHLAGSTLDRVEAVAVSGATGEGLPALTAALDRLVGRLPAPRVDGPVRLWVDRAFTISGSGTVVTGTLGAGTLRVGDELLLNGARVRVRGLQSLGAPHDEVAAVARVAVNLRRVERTEVARGDVLLTPDAWASTAAVDVRLTADPRELPAQLLLHVGTAAVAVHLRPLGTDTARLTLPRPLPLRAGDRAVLRDPGGHRVAAGVLLLDADPPPLRRRGAAAERAAALASATGTPELAMEVARRGAVRRAELVALGVAVEPAADVVDLGEWLVAADRWAAWCARAAELVDEHAAAEPLAPDLPADLLHRELGLPERRLLAAVVAASGLESVGAKVRRPGVVARLGPAEPAVAELEQRLRGAPFAAPEQPELTALGLGRRELAAAEAAGRLVRLGDDVVLLADAPVRALTLLAALPQPFTASEARQALATTRRVAIPLLEHLDASGATRRVSPTQRVVADPPRQLGNASA